MVYFQGSINLLAVNSLLPSPELSELASLSDEPHDSERLPAPEGDVGRSPVRQELQDGGQGGTGAEQRL